MSDFNRVEMTDFSKVDRSFLNEAGRLAAASFSFPSYSVSCSYCTKMTVYANLDSAVKKGWSAEYSYGVKKYLVTCPKCKEKRDV